VEHPKPHAEGMLFIMKELGVTPEITAVVGDSPNDMKAAVAAGALPIGIPDRTHSAQELKDAGAVYIIRSFYDLFVIFGEDRFPNDDREASSGRIYHN